MQPFTQSAFVPAPYRERVTGTISITRYPPEGVTAAPITYQRRSRRASTLDEWNGPRWITCVHRLLAGTSIP